MMNFNKVWQDFLKAARQKLPFNQMARGDVYYITTQMAQDFPDFQIKYDADPKSNKLKNVGLLPPADAIEAKVNKAGVAFLKAAGERGLPVRHNLVLIYKEDQTSRATRILQSRTSGTAGIR